MVKLYNRASQINVKHLPSARHCVTLSQHNALSLHSYTKSLNFTFSWSWIQQTKRTHPWSTQHSHKHFKGELHHMIANFSLPHINNAHKEFQLQGHIAATHWRNYLTPLVTHIHILFWHCYVMGHVYCCFLCSFVLTSCRTRKSVEKFVYSMSEYSIKEGVIF